MKKFSKTLIVLVIFLLLLYKYQDNILVFISPYAKEIATQVGIAQAPCGQPIPYNLGTFDTQFGISKEDFLSALALAEAIWEKPLNKNFFIYSPDDSGGNVLKINLVYDYRQQATSKLAGMGITVSDNRASYNALKAQFTDLKAQYNSAKSSFDDQVASFNQQQKDYNDQVNSWNQQGGAPPDEYAKLEDTQAELQNESAQLQTAQKNINSMVDQINAMVVVLNRLVATLNLSVDQYNTVNGTLGDSFEEGVYVQDASGLHIDIYEYTNHDKLVRVLAHELGHALGMEHVTDPNAIMYKFNQGNSLALTQADIDELKAVCGIK